MGPGYTKAEGRGGSDLILESADKLRRVRFDLVNSHGLEPHINVEVLKPRYPGASKLVEDVKVHVFLKK